MQRITITLDDDLMDDLDAAIVQRDYQNRSEAIRDFVRAGLRESSIEPVQSDNCVAALVYTYDHGARQLSRRLVKTFHDHHDLSLATMHVHLNHDYCMEVAILRGPTTDIHHLAEHVIAERGVRHGRLVLIPADVDDADHRHGDRDGSATHSHIKVR